ncbi:DUF429 domain-containing protein [Agromyces aurantiacus]|uniref:DUF429 domain-containing protein n=1 Tax=Agromyces aurantiacus TaxID=165814 RepID=A0ABV9R1Y9_9MICO|nr:DUF429 domain-containing protein [Agromyces aurantiacus]MBM7505926.1 putative nuclease with RNAse H fold [Agromyces aurantiacus]
MRTAGVDLAAESKKTALATVRWESGRGVAERVEVAVGDDRIVEVAAEVDAIGIDCAFGWPDDFVEFVSRHARGERVDLARDRGADWRRRLAYRETDRDIQRRTGFRPLSVATDRLGLTAMHCAALLDELGDRLGPVARSGSGPVVEVYPAAALRVWGLIMPRYKTEASVRSAMLDVLRERHAWLDLAAVADEMIRTDDAFDAVIAALIARAHATGSAHPVPAAQRERADREGWIALPSTELDALVAP